MSILKVAFPTEEGQTISRHFGRAPFFKVITLQNNVETAVELRGSSGGEDHAHHEHDHSHDEGQQHGHGHDHGHGAKFALIADCQVLIGAGMGRPAYDRLQDMGLEVFLTGEKMIGEALAKYLDGALTSDMRRIHAHHHHEHESKANVTFFDETKTV